MTGALAVVALVSVVLAAALWRRVESLRADVVSLSADADAGRESLDAAVRSVASLRAALDEVPQGVVVCGDDGREVVRNRAAEAFSGARHSEVLIEQAVVDELRAALDGTPVQRTVDVLGPPRRIVSVTASPLAGGGAVAVIDDVSERRRVEAMRRDFVSNISHELKTPVGALGVLAETIVDADDPDVVRRLAGRMTGEALRVGRIIDDLLALTRLESEDDASVRDRVRVADAVTDAVARVRDVAASQRIQIDTAGIGPGNAVVCDRRQLVSAVVNLLENACKYSDAGSSVEVRSRVAGGWIEIEVEDHGIGIPSSDLDRIFERFYRVDRARSRETGGTGLGLAIVRHVATNHDGEVTVRSTEGVGSTFTLRIPTGGAS